MIDVNMRNEKKLYKGTKNVFLAKEDFPYSWIYYSRKKVGFLVCQKQISKSLGYVEVGGKITKMLP